MSKISKALRMIELLHARGKMKSSELAYELNIDARTVRDYKKDIANANIDIKSERGRYGGYYISNTSLFPIKNLSPKELTALTFSIEQLVAKGNPIYSDDAQVALDKLKALSKIEADKARYIYFVQRSRPNYEPSEESRKYLKLQEAFSRGNKVRIKYENNNGRKSERTIEPYGFVHYNEFFYCVAFCHNRQEIRKFKLVRIKDIQVLFDRYTIPENFDLEGECPRLGIVNETFEVELIIYPPFSKSIPESIWGEEQEIQQNSDGSINFKAMLSGKSSVKKWILGMGGSVKVIKPEGMKEEIVEEGRRMLGVYDLL
ncbi:helix-turn-helix transcriptional regulator [Bacillus cereus]|uniref:helix-turn-helix transcriptional regulator n=1 Tax=Bacillus cereus TaxID=1396 RepID=UPI002ABEA65E|nr:WYL domain-containing protein [Bacillus cereus]MDZ4478283.1 WYL domain-containing protein [Bacillus cereus]MDZ4494593.1 WYL domain-containing protein [Bacillus cereus]MDZ4517278.1 WYL domain-containing protein [Bacillus cereus]